MVHGSTFFLCLGYFFQNPFCFALVGNAEITKLTWSGKVSGQFAIYTHALTTAEGFETFYQSNGKNGCKYDASCGSITFTFGAR